MVIVPTKNTEHQRTPGGAVLLTLYDLSESAVYSEKVNLYGFEIPDALDNFSLLPS